MMPFDWRLYFRVFRLAFGDATTAKRYRVLVLMAIVFPLLNLAGNIGMWLDLIFFPGLRSTEIEKPVFITGHARSGTTLIHKLLSRDQRFTYFMTYELLMPSIVQKVVVRWLIALDREYLGSYFAKKVTAWEDRTFAVGRQMHPMGLTLPEEDGFLMVPTFMQSQLGFFFPYQAENDRLFYVDQGQLSQRHIDRVLGFYREAVRRLVYLNGKRGRTEGGSAPIFLSKNPCFMGSIKQLERVFPGARFVVMMRNPYQTIPSLLKMMVRNWKMLGFEGETRDAQLALLKQQCLYYYSYPFEVLPQLPANTSAFVDYRELVESPSKTIEQLYAELDFEVTDAFAEQLREEEARSKKHRAEHVYSLDEFGLTREEIREALPEAFERFGWDVPESTE